MIIVSSHICLFRRSIRRGRKNAFQAIPVLSLFFQTDWFRSILIRWIRSIDSFCAFYGRCLFLGYSDGKVFRRATRVEKFSEGFVFHNNKCDRTKHSEKLEKDVSVFRKCLRLSGRMYPSFPGKELVFTRNAGFVPSETSLWGVKDSFFLILFFPLVPNQGKESRWKRRFVIFLSA